MLSYRAGSHNAEILAVGARYVLFLQKAGGTEAHMAIKSWQLVNGYPKPIEVEDVRSEAAGEIHYSAITEGAFLDAVKESASR